LPNGQEEINQSQVTNVWMRSRPGGAASARRGLAAV